MPYFSQKFEINTPFNENPVVSSFKSVCKETFTFKTKYNLDYLRLALAKQHHESNVQHHLANPVNL